MGSTGPRFRGNKVSVEDLLEALNTPEETEEVESSSTTDSSVLSFVMSYRITPGDYPVTGRLFYELYKCWAHHPMKRQAFMTELGKYVVPDKSYYYIDRPALKVSEEIEQYLAKHTRSATKVKSYKKHFENFLTKYSLKPGNYYIETYVLYYLYDKWTYGIKKKMPLGQIQFMNLCQLYFKSKRNSKSRVTWFGVDKESLLKAVTFTQIVNIRKGRKKRYGRPKEQPKKPQEVLSSRPQDESKD